MNELNDWVQERRTEGMRITSCCPCNEGWFVVMTGGFENAPLFILETEDNEQNPLSEILLNSRLNGYDLGGISYNPNTGRYLIYGKYDNNYNNKTIHKWFLEEHFYMARLWLRDKMRDGFKPYHIFKDPKSCTTLISVTTDDQLKITNVEFAMDYTQKPQKPQKPVTLLFEESEESV